jgi:hypothetical protein
MLNQNWRLKSEPLAGETGFRTFSIGVTGGYYVHFGRHFYLYPTTASESLHPGPPNTRKLGSGCGVPYAMPTNERTVMFRARKRPPG